MNDGVELKLRPLASKALVRDMVTDRASSLFPTRPSDARSALKSTRTLAPMAMSAGAAYSAGSLLMTRDGQRIASLSNHNSKSDPDATKNDPGGPTAYSMPTITSDALITA